MLNIENNLSELATFLERPPIRKMPNPELAYYLWALQTMHNQLGKGRLQREEPPQAPDLWPDEIET